MLVCDLCGGKDKVSSARLEFSVQKVDTEAVGIMHVKDVCDNCYTKLYNMIHVVDGSPTLDGVLSKGLDLKQKVIRDIYVDGKLVNDHYNK